MNDSTAERLKKAAEKVRAEKAREEAKDLEYFERITTGTPWMVFKILVGWCVLFTILTTIDVFVDGSTEKLSQNDIEINRGRLGAYGVQSIWVGNDLFTPTIEEWVDFDENSYQLTRSLIFQDEKYFSFEKTIYGTDDVVRIYCKKRISIYTYFPYLQIMLLLPLLVFLFKQPKPWFKFGRFVCLLLIGPGSLVVLITLLV